MVHQQSLPGSSVQSSPTTSATSKLSMKGRDVWFLEVSTYNSNELWNGAKKKTFAWHNTSRQIGIESHQWWTRSTLEETRFAGNFDIVNFFGTNCTSNETGLLTILMWMKSKGLDWIKIISRTGRDVHYIKTGDSACFCNTDLCNQATDLVSSNLVFMSLAVVYNIYMI